MGNSSSSKSFSGKIMPTRRSPSHNSSSSANQDYLLYRKWEILNKEQKDGPPVTCSSHSWIYNNMFYIFGGRLSYGEQRSNNMFFFDLEKNKWEKVQYNSKLQGSIRSAGSAIVIGHHVYFFGGLDDITAVRKTERFNLKTLEWELLECKGDIPPLRASHTAWHYGKWMYILGGDSTLAYELDEMYNDLYKLDLETLEWKCVFRNGNDVLPKILCAPSCQQANSPLVYIVGGEAINVLNSIFVFDCINDKVEQIFAREPMHITQHRCVMYQKKIYAFGGYIPEVTTEAIDRQGKLITFDLEKNEWSIVPIGNCIEPLHRRAHCMHLWSNKIIMAGGFDDINTIGPEVFSIMIDKPDWSVANAKFYPSDFNLFVGLFLLFKKFCPRSDIARLPKPIIFEIFRHLSK